MAPSSESADLAIPAPIEALADQVHDAGGTAWLVGGCVRDHLMGLPVKDWDVEVHGLEVERLEKLLRRLGKVDAVGRSFGVLKLRPKGWREPEIDVSLPRRDSNNGPGHRGIAVEGDPFMPLDEAVRRRDLTINALLVDIRTRRLEDRVGGLDDLRAGRLRAVDVDAFLEDPLRALRVVQFAARTGFAADETLIELCRQAPLHELPAERVQGEWQKLLLKGEHLVHAFALARRAALLERVFPEHDPVDVTPLQQAVPLRAPLDDGRAWSLMLALWLRADTEVEATLDRLWLHKVGGYNVRKKVLALVAHQDDPFGDDPALRHLSVATELDLALRMREALGRDTAPARARAGQLGILHEPPPPFLQGRDLITLGVPRGPSMGVWVRRAYQAQLDGAFTTREGADAWIREALATST